MQKHKTIVKIGGKEYTMVGTETEAYIKKVAECVDHMRNEIHINTGLTEPKLMVLTALNLADELLKAQAEVKQIRKEVNLLRRQAGMQKRNAARNAGEKQNTVSTDSKESGD